jgi:hypothetical protein
MQFITPMVDLGLRIREGTTADNNLAEFNFSLKFCSSTPDKLLRVLG